MVTRPLLASCALLAANALPAHAFQAPCNADVVHEDLFATLDGPRLVFPDGAPVGGGPISFQVVEGRPLAPGIFFFGPEAPFYDPPLGAVLYPGPPFTILGFVTDADGASPLMFQAAELDPYLCGESVAVQSAVVDVDAMGGVAVSNAVRVTVGLERRPLFAEQRLPVPFATEYCFLDCDRVSGPIVADLDADGLPDIATIWEDVEEILVYFGQGSRRFSPTSVPLDQTTPVLPSVLFAGRFDAGATIDLGLYLYTPAGDVVFGVLPGVGNGTFLARVDTPITGLVHPPSSNSEPDNFLDAADVDGDGVLDLVVLLGSGIDVRLGLGDGSFAPPATTTLVNPAGAFQVADLDGDGDAELLTNGPSGIDVYLNMAGTFVSAGSGVLTGDALRVADMDGDGFVDLWTREQIALGNGDGTFDTAFDHTLELIGGNQDLGPPVLTDFDGDGITDVVAIESNATYGVWLGDGTGDFERTFEFQSTRQPGIADLDGDGVQDAVLERPRRSDPNALVTRFGLGRGRFDSGLKGFTSRTPVDAAFGDLDGDGDTDMVQVDNGAEPLDGGGIVIQLGNGDGTFGPVSEGFFASRPDHVALGDLDDDGHLDFVVTHSIAPNWRTVFRGNGDGTFAFPDYESGWPAGDLELHDLDLDGDLDLLATAPVAAGELIVAAGNGDGTFTPRASADTYPVGNVPGELEVADFDGDGWPDVAVALEVSPALVWLRGGAGGALQSAASIPAAVLGCPMPGSNCFVEALFASDLDRDGNVDLAVHLDEGPERLSLLLGDGTGAFTEQSSTPLPQAAYGTALADLDGDGFPDLVTGSALDLWVWRGNGDGSLASPDLHTGVQILFTERMVVAAPDLDGDGTPDLLAATFRLLTNTPNLFTFLNQLGERTPYERCLIDTQEPVQAGVPKAFSGRNDSVGTAIASHAWHFGDGGTGSGPMPVHSFAQPGTYEVTLVLTDVNGRVEACGFLQEVTP